MTIPTKWLTATSVALLGNVALPLLLGNTHIGESDILPLRLLLHGCHKSVLAFLQKLPDTTENFQRLENLFENRKLSKNNTASSKNTA